MNTWIGTTGPRFAERGAHRQWLMTQAWSLLTFFQRGTFNPAGGFFTLDTGGRPIPAAQEAAGVVRHLHDTTRLVHCFAIAHLLGLPGADRFVDHGLRFIRTRHRDADNGGYFWAVDDRQPTDSTKQAYGHAFVILAASSAHVVGHPQARALLDDVMNVLDRRFWDESVGATTEEYTADWQSRGDYRGQNSNMHLTEALMAAYEAFGESRYLSMAERIAELIIHRHARTEDWRVAEHFTERWEVDRLYAGDPMFRPAGTTPGHALEWSRLLVQLWELGSRQRGWLLEAATALFKRTVESAWNEDTGGFYYTLDWEDRAARTGRYWWPCAEGIGAAAVLSRVVDDDPVYEYWYRKIWGFVNLHVIDHVNGGWHPELDGRLRPVSRVFTGKPDLYHALQACLIPLVSTDGSLTRGLMQADVPAGI